MMSPETRRERPGTSYRTVSRLLEAHCRRDPAKEAVVDVDRDRRITFGELAAAVNGIAAQLVDIGVRKGARVVLAADTSIEKIVLWLAIWRIGAVVCPLDLSFIRAAASTTLKTIDPDLIIAGEQQYGADALKDISVPVARFIEWEAGGGAARSSSDRMVLSMAASSDAAMLPPSPAATDIACLSCTSGTTGAPKIVVYDHLAYWENGLDSIELLGLRENDRTLEYRSFEWCSPQILSLMPFLQTGLTLHLARKFSSHQLPDWIERYRITVCVGVPTVISILLNNPAPRAGRRLDSLRAFTSSSAPLMKSKWIRFEEMYGVPLVNLYGSSETGWICGNRLDSRKIGTVGRKAAHVELDIVTESEESCPPGSPGRVVVSAEKLAVGYLQPDGALEVIRGKPFVMRDVAVMDDEGFVQILGRTDDLINRGGVKISPSEVEEIVLGYPGVQEAAAIGIPDPIYGQQPACFVVPQPGAALDESALLAHCAARLAREKVPVRAIVVASLPRNDRGKLRRDRLVESYCDLYLKQTRAI